jgi:hypothetical protein
VVPVGAVLSELQVARIQPALLLTGEGSRALQSPEPSRVGQPVDPPRGSKVPSSSSIRASASSTLDR